MNDQVLDWLYGVLVSPVQTLRVVAHERPAGAAVILLFATALLQAMAGGPIAASQMSAFELELSRAWIIVGGSALSFLGSLVGIVVVYAASALFRPSGDLAGTLSSIGFARFPALLGVPAGLLSGATGLGFLGGLISFGVGLWTLVLAVIALRESRGLTTWTSVFSYLLGGVAVFVIVALLIIPILLLSVL